MGGLTNMDDVLQSITMRVDREAIRAYAEITGDFNPIHVDPEFAATTSMGGVIAHGTLSLNLVLQAIGKTLGAQALKGATVDVRFVKPVREGDLLEAGGKADARVPGKYEVWVRNATGVAVIEGVVSILPDQ